MTASAPRGRQSGFTLLELMLAIGIFGLIVAMLAGSFSQVAQSKVRAESLLDGERQARNVLWRIADDLRDALQNPLAGSRASLLGVGETRNGVPLDSVSVGTLGPGPKRSVRGFGAEELVSYDLAPNPSHRGWFILDRSEVSGLVGATGLPREPIRVPLARNVLALHITYFDGTIWQESWNSTSLPPGRQLPLAIAVDLEVALSERESINLSTRVTLPMAVSQW